MDLKSQVALLRVHNAQLEEENKILRRAANPEILARLDSESSRESSPAESPVGSPVSSP